MSILIRQATIITMDRHDRVIPRGDLLVEGDRIAQVTESGTGVPPEIHGQDAHATLVIEAEGMIALPGLINAHTHCAMTLMRGVADDMPLMPWLEQKIWPMEERLSEEDVYWGSLLGIAEMIRAGVTTFADMYWFFEATARAAAESGIRAVLSGVLIGLRPTFGSELEEAISFARQWRGAADGRIVVMLGPHAPYTCPEPVLRAVAEAARELGVGIHIHLSETAQEVADSLRDHRMTPIAWADRLGAFSARPALAAHCVHLEEGDINLLAERGVGVAHNPGSNMKLASGVAPVPRMLERGVTVGLGTDGAASNNNLDLLEEARLAALLHKVGGDPTAVPAYRALEMATRLGARALGLEDRIGSLAPGMKADLILLDARRPHLAPFRNPVSHLIYSARAGDVRTVLVDGKPLLLDGRLQGLDETEIIARASERAERLLAIPPR